MVVLPEAKNNNEKYNVNIRKMSYSLTLTYWFSVALSAVISQKESQTETDTPSSQNIAYQIVGDFPHDTTSFTEGFFNS
ncbi:MAG: glutaminyl-peptide cyclotransferase [Cytophagaceae bacterium]|nr:glutaminyl-peptide cyclotransferase [Cytophagaceae bacterium]